MRAAAAIGCALDGTRQAVETRVEVEHGTVTFGAPWEAPASALRGAVCAAILDAHVDLHGHGPDGLRQVRATVYYRVHGGRAQIYAYGPRARAHLLDVARLETLCLPSGQRVATGDAALEMGTVAVGIDAKRWHRYSVEAYYPSSVVQARRPRGGPELDAWAGQALASSVRMLFADLGLVIEEARPVHVQVHRIEHGEVEWRDKRTPGFVARFVSNAILPDGIGLGQHVSEGSGEVRRC